MLLIAFFVWDQVVKPNMAAKGLEALQGDESDRQGFTVEPDEVQEVDADDMDAFFSDDEDVVEQESFITED